MKADLEKQKREVAAILALVGSISKQPGGLPPAIDQGWDALFNNIGNQ